MPRNSSQPEASALPHAAAAAWQAYLQMCESKRRYFEQLRCLEDMRRRGAAPSLAQSLLHERLLAEHSARTATFGEEVKRLAVADPQAHHLLLEQLAVPGVVAEAPSS